VLAIAPRAWGAEGLAEGLARIEQLAGRQPAEAQRQLEALLHDKRQLGESAELQFELVRALIADAQYRSADVLAISTQVRDRMQRLGNPRMLASLAHVRASALYQLGRSEEQWLALQEELEQAKLAGEDDLVAMALVNRVRFYMRRNDYAAAAEAVADARKRVHGAQAGAEADFSGAQVAKSVGDWEMALRDYQDARAKFQTVGDQTGVADALAGSAFALCELGRAAEAIGPLGQADAIYRTVGDQDGQAVVANELAMAYARHG
jgi:tetratricopeptide (TPR) repeat protein